MFGIRRRSLRAFTLFVLVAAVALPAPAMAQSVSLADATEQIGPGVTLREHTYVTPDGWWDVQILRVELGRSGVSGDLLTAGPSINDRAPVSAMVKQRRAVAGVNGDFFDISGAGGPLGMQIQDGSLLKGASPDGRLHAGVGKDGVGRLVDAALNATAVLNGEGHKVTTFNTPAYNVPADFMTAFTPLWGAADRARGAIGVPAAELAQAVISDGKVISVTAEGVTSEPIPADGFVLVGRGKQAEVLRGLKVGDPAAFSYQLADPVARQLRFAIGGNHIIVRDGKAQPVPDPVRAPRTGIGFSQDGKTMWLVTADGRQSQVKGPTVAQFGQLLADAGAYTAMNLDGGGSTTMLARALGDAEASVRNTPSDGTERDDPNGVGVFLKAGDGEVDDLVLRPADTSIFPGMQRTLTAAAVDDRQAPVKISPSDVRWSARRGHVANGVFRAPRNAERESTLKVSAQSGRAAADLRLRVLGKLKALEPSVGRIAMPAAKGSESVAIVGRDEQGYTANVELADLDLEYDRSVLRVRPAPDGIEIEPIGEGATIVRINVDGVRASIAVTVGVRTETVTNFDGADEVSRWKTNGTAPAEQKLSMQDGKLRLDYSARRNQGITFGDENGLPLPGQPLRIRIKLQSSAAQQFASAYWVEASGRRRNQLVGPLSVGSQSVQWELPSDVQYPIAFTMFQTIETAPSKQAPGNVVFESLEVDVAPGINPDPEPLPQPDPIISDDGRLPEDGWRFAAISDVQFTSRSRDLSEAAIGALRRARRDNPDLVVLNGDIIDTASAEDVRFAREVLEKGGCEMVAPGSENQPVADGKVACLYVPGNHESYSADSGQGDLTEWSKEFGAPYRTFDHKGTRMILLDSSRGSVRSSDFAQLPFLVRALEEAKKNEKINNVLVFAHHPVEDPLVTDQSQLGDRMEVALIKKLLGDFRDRSNKPAAMVGSHAAVVDARRYEGVPYLVLPNAGKSPYGTPDRGGFTGYVRFNVDGSRDPGERWLAADVRAYAQSVKLTAPARLVRGATARLSGEIVQPNGVEQNGKRVVPLRYPMSVAWGGSRSLQVGGSVERARRDGKVALLDPASGELTAIRPGRVTVTVTNESMREDTLDPVVGAATIQITDRADGETPPSDRPGESVPGTPGVGSPGGGDSGPGPDDETSDVTSTEFNLIDMPSKKPGTSAPEGTGTGRDQNGRTSARKRRPRAVCRVNATRRSLRCRVSVFTAGRLKATVRVGKRSKTVSGRRSVRVELWGRNPIAERARVSVRVWAGSASWRLKVRARG